MSERLVINPMIRHNSRYFGSWVRSLRKQRGYTQRQIARATGKSISWICEFEKGRRGLRLNDPEFFISLAEYLHVDISTVLEAANIPKTKDDERHKSVYTMFRNRALAQRVINTLDSLDDTCERLSALSMNSNGRIQHMCQILCIQLEDLKSALKLI